MEKMRTAGYGDRKHQNKSLKEVFALAKRRTKEQNDINRTAKRCQKTFTRMKQDYTSHIANISQSGRDGDDEGLFDMPDYFEKMHEVEHNKVRQAPPAVLNTANSTGDWFDTVPTAVAKESNYS